MNNCTPVRIPKNIMKELRFIKTFFMETYCILWIRVGNYKLSERRT